MTRRPLITIKEAAENAKLPVHTMRRQLKAMNDQAGGKLLVSRSSGATRKWWVATGALDELLELRRLERTGYRIQAEIDYLDKAQKETDQITEALGMRTDEHTRKLDSHERWLRGLERKVRNHGKALKALQKASGFLAEATEYLTEKE